MHSETLYIPMCTDSKDQQWFAPNCLDYTMRDAKAKFLDGDNLPWAYWRKEGWRIVKVRISEL